MSIIINAGLLLCILWNIYESNRLRKAYAKMAEAIKGEEEQRKRLADTSEKYIAMTEELFRRSEQKSLGEW